MVCFWEALQYFQFLENCSGIKKWIAANWVNRAVMLFSMGSKYLGTYPRLVQPLPARHHEDTNDQCVDVIWAKAARGVWGLAHVFNNKMFFTRDIMDDDAVPKHFNVPEPKPKPKPKPAPKPTAAPKPGPKGGSTDRNSGWCIIGRRVSRLSQLNSRSSHASWKARYSPVS